MHAAGGDNQSVRRVALKRRRKTRDFSGDVVVVLDDRREGIAVEGGGLPSQREPRLVVGLDRADELGDDAPPFVIVTTSPFECEPSARNISRAAIVPLIIYTSWCR